MAGDPDFREEKLEIGRRVRERREASGLSAFGLARRLGHTNSGYVHRLEGGEGNPGILMLVRLAHVLEIDPGVLTQGLAVASRRRAAELPPALSDDDRRRPKVAVGRRVRARRLDLGLTQEGLSEQTGIHETHIRQVEYGNVDMPLGSLIRLCRGLAVDLADLLRGL